MDGTQIAITVIGAVVAVPAAVAAPYFGYRIAKLSAATHESVGGKNGSGSIQDQLAELRTTQAADHLAHLEGVQRQVRIEDAVAKIAATLAEHTAWQTNHGEEDLAVFEELRVSVEHLRDILGEPSDSMAGGPLIPYVHDLAHDIKNYRQRELLTEVQTEMLMEALDLIRKNHDGVVRIEAASAAVAADLTATHERANAVPDGEPGAAADAAAKDEKP